MLDKLIVILYCNIAVDANGILYPHDSESREVKLLNGFWQFRLEDIPGEGVSNEWYAQKMTLSLPTQSMPVPSSYNLLTEDYNIRDHVGVVWYDRNFYVPKYWHGLRVWIRFSSVNYLATVWVNGQYITTHEFGGLPFQAEVTTVLNYGQDNLITVSVNNTLTENTIPSGDIQELETSNGTIIRQSTSYYNYAGIDGQVFIYTTPTLYVDDITLITDIHESTGIVKFTVSCEGLSSFSNIVFTIKILDRTETVVAERVETIDDSVFSDTIEISDAVLWWPLYMTECPGYLYTFQVTVSTTVDNEEIEDTYRLQFGIRTISFTASELLINNKPVYIRGLGGNQYSDMRGRGFDQVAVKRDLILLSWMGTNTIRFANTPLPEETLDATDEGLIIIDQCPFLRQYFNPDVLTKHEQYFTELIQRDKNRPSVIMWSIGNQLPAGEGDDNYYGSVVDHIKTLDGIRPVTGPLSQFHLYNGHVAQYLDILGISASYGWNTYPGVLGAIEPAMLKELEAWQEKYAKPLFMMEYGADAISGRHIYPEWPWSEEYQISFLSRYFEVFDMVRNQSNTFIGEMVAAAVGQSGAVRNGVITGQREPRCAAQLVRRRYNHLANQIDGQPLPPDLEVYAVPGERFHN